MRAAWWSKAALLLALAVAACSRDNPAYVWPGDAGPQTDAGGHDASPQGDGATEDGSLPSTCVPDGLACLGRVLLKCGAEGTWAPLQECPSLCIPGDGAHCGGFYTSNGVPKCGHQETFDDYVAVTGALITIDTDSFTIDGRPWTAHGEVAQTDGPAIALFQFGSFEIPAGARVVAVGKRALAIWAAYDVVVAGGLRAGGAVTSPLPVQRTPAGAWTSEATWTAGVGEAGLAGSGFGGGGYGDAGGAGGAGPLPDPAAGGAGGAAFGSESLVPLRGGSPGAAVTSNRAITTGGGAIQIVACRSFMLRANAVVSANGRGGAPGTMVPSTGNFTLYGGDGGGSGGAILIESPLIYYAGVLAANGGGGGGGAALINATPVAASPGEDGHEDTLQAAGGVAATGGGAGGPGGAKLVPQGGAGLQPPGAGVFTAGGGGGAVGRVRLNVTKLVSPDLGIVEGTGHALSPTPSFGQLEIW
jgi:hypothetical protein